MIPNDETVRVLRAIHALLADALASPDRGPGATGSDATPAEAAPEDPPTPERPREGDSDLTNEPEALWTNDAQVGDDPDLESVVRAQLDGHGVECHGTVRITSARIARATRKHIEAEWKPYILREQTAREKAQDRATKAEAERDEFNGFWKDALADVRKAREERDDWQAKHAALRADVERHRGQCAENADDTTASYGHRGRCAHTEDTLKVILRSDAARDPQPPEPDADTVTLRREDVEALLNHGVLSPTQRADAVRRVRAALGWGDEA